MGSTESGATMSEGPSRPHSKRRYARKAITWGGMGRYGEIWGDVGEIY